LSGRQARHGQEVPRPADPHRMVSDGGPFVDESNGILQEKAEGGN
jgi:hypothetical protein